MATNRETNNGPSYEVPPRKAIVAAQGRIAADGLLSKERFRVFSAVCAIVRKTGKPCTSGEVFAHLQRTEGVGRNPISSSRSRFSELRALGVVFEAGERKCRESGRNCMTWAPTGNLPNAKSPPKRKAAGKCSHATGRHDETCDLVAGLESDLAKANAERAKLAERVAALTEQLADLSRDHDRVVEERDAAMLNCPYPYCPECDAPATKADADGCCAGCGADPIWPTTHDAAFRYRLAQAVNARGIVAAYLTTYGFDGLFSEGCGCEADDLAPCGENWADCEPGHKIPCDPLFCHADGDCPWHIGRRINGASS